MGIIFILIGFFMIFLLLPDRVGGGLIAVLILPGMWIFSGVAMLIGVAIFKADERARRRESAILDTRTKVKKVTETVHENRELVGSCIVCKGYLYAGDSIASCPRCKGIAHRGDLLEWIPSKELAQPVGDIWTKIRCKNSSQKENEVTLFQ
jgi:hypothetical protein